MEGVAPTARSLTVHAAIKGTVRWYTPNDWCPHRLRWTKVAYLQNQASMADSKDLNDVSPNNDTKLANLSVVEHKKLEYDIKKYDFIPYVRVWISTTPAGTYPLPSLSV